MENIMEENVRIFKIREIAERKTAKRKVEIPVFQRSLVWKPKQMELLWDSILRGFPIGSFTLSESDTSNNLDGKNLYLVDGQQRFNSIGIGFDDSVWRKNKEKNDELTTVLWLDIAHENTNKSSRKFWIRTTTKYHPWGYEDNDECNTLNAQGKRKAMEKYGLKSRNIYKDSISLRETWPYKANLPIPFYLFLQQDFTSEASKDNFLKTIIEEIEKKAPLNWKKAFWESENIGHAKSRIRDLYEVFEEVNNYSVSGTLLSNKVIEKEAENKNNEEATDLEILFNRLGTGGTQITQSELIYSAITAYWGEIKDKNEELAKKYMPPTNLVALAFRLILTQENKDEPAGTPAIPKIRDLKRDETFKDKLIELYKNKLSGILAKVDRMISGDDADETPVILKLDIYKNHSDLMLLLMYMADKKFDIDNNFMRAFVFYTLWFSENENRIVKAVFKQINNPNLSSKENVMKVLFECVHSEFIVPIPNLNNLFENGNLPNKHAKVYNLLKNNRNLLLFAQRKHLNDTFPNYKPVSSFDWEEHNRPWDFDHIIPKTWISGKRGQFRDKCKEYLETIGNLAAIPFERNREKNDLQNWDYYDEHKDSLFFDQALIKDINSSITKNKSMADSFIHFCKTRMNLIFNNCYEALFKHIHLDIELSSENIKLIPENASKRKSFFEGLRRNNKKLKDFKLYYADNDSLTDIEVDETKVIDWSRSWISLGCVKDDGFMIAITSKNGTAYEIGLRRLPTDTATKEAIVKKIEEKFKNIDSYDITNQNVWWYLEKDFTEDIENEFLKFVDLFD